MGQRTAGRAIVTTADEVEADLIFMSTHARTGPARAVLGSVANEVVRHAGRPVLLIRREPRGLDAADLRPEQTSSTAVESYYELAPDAFAEPVAGLPCPPGSTEPSAERQTSVGPVMTVGKDTSLH